ncbi:MAG: response regulator [Planctomycetota bacterium]
MLVLSRKVGEAIVFPSLDITLTVSKVRGSSVALAIEAPNQVRVLRKELVPRLQNRCAQKLGHQMGHDFRNQLNAAGLSLNVLLRQTEAGQAPDANMLKQALGDLQRLDESLASVSQNGDALPQSEKPIVLIVEDNENESALLTALLRSHGFRVVNALDGRAALNFLDYAPRSPDIVLLDMNMPRMNGKETVSQIRRRPELNSLKLFAVSGMTSDSAEVPVGSGGVDRWFRKPIQPDELVLQIDRELAA